MVQSQGVEDLGSRVSVSIVVVNASDCVRGLLVYQSKGLAYIAPVRQEGRAKEQDRKCT